MNEIRGVTGKPRSGATNEPVPSSRYAASVLRHQYSHLVDVDAILAEMDSDEHSVNGIALYNLDDFQERVARAKVVK